MNGKSEWQRKGASLTDGTAQERYGLKRTEILRAIRAGKLSYRIASIYGNPCFRLLRREVEQLVEERKGRSYLEDRRIKTELAGITRELGRLDKQTAALESRKSELMKLLSRETEVRRPAAAKRKGK